jgi:hypothetical protein
MPIVITSLALKRERGRMSKYQPRNYYYYFCRRVQKPRLKLILAGGKKKGKAAENRQNGS